MPILKFNHYIKEALTQRIQDKDWDRMADLILKGDDGETLSKLVKEKQKAMNRFVAGCKLEGYPLSFSEFGFYNGRWNDLGNKALKLGASPEEIQKLYDEAVVPQKYLDKVKNLSSKKLDGFPGPISKAILNMGFDIEYLPHSGNALTWEGRDAMDRNGRKWTIGYKSQINLGDRKVSFNFDVLTDEGGGTSYYVLDRSSDRMFNWSGGKLGISQFLSNLKRSLASVQQPQLSENKTEDGFTGSYTVYDEDQEEKVSYKVKPVSYSKISDILKDYDQSSYLSNKKLKSLDWFMVTSKPYDPSYICLDQSTGKWYSVIADSSVEPFTIPKNLRSNIKEIVKAYLQSEYPKDFHLKISKMKG